MLRLIFFILPLAAILAGGCTAVRPGGPETASPEGWDAPPVEPDDLACAYFNFLWGQSAEAEQRFDEALEAYEKVLACDQDSTYVARTLAMLLMRMGRDGEAADRLAAIVAAHPDDIETQSLLAKLYIRMDRTAEAANIYEKILARGQDAETMLQLAILQARDRRYDAARETLNRLIVLEPDYFMGHYYLARLERELHNFTAAAPAYEKALAIHWSVGLAAEVAEFYESVRQYEKAAALYREIIGDDGASEEISLKLVNVYLAMDQEDEAIAALRQLRLVGGDSQRIDLFIGRILIVGKRYDEAIPLLSGLRARNPDLPGAGYLLALAHFHNGNHPEAARLLVPIRPADPEYAESVMLLVRIHRDAGDQAGAVRLLEEKIGDSASRRPDFYFVLAALYQEEGETVKAGEVFEKAMAAFGDEAEVHYEYGLFLERSGDGDGAMARMQAVLEKDPDHASALNYIGYTWAERNTNLEQALEYIQRAVALRPRDGYIRDSLGWVHYKLGNLDRAVAELETAVQLTGHDPVILEHLGDVYLRAGRMQEAANQYEQALSLYRQPHEKETVRNKLEALTAGRP